MPGSLTETAAAAARRRRCRLATSFQSKWHTCAQDSSLPDSRTHRSPHPPVFFVFRSPAVARVAIGISAVVLPSWRPATLRFRPGVPRHGRMLGCRDACTQPCMHARMHACTRTHLQGGLRRGTRRDGLRTSNGNNKPPSAEPRLPYGLAHDTPEPNNTAAHQPYTAMRSYRPWPIADDLHNNVDL